MNPLKLYFSRNRVPHVHFNPPTNLDYNYITDGIYMGTNQCCTVGLTQVLKNEGIQGDISLEEVRIDQPFGVEVYVWIPTADHFSPTPEKLSFGVATLEKLVAQGKKIYLHCKNGHGRSSTLLCAYLMKNKGMTAVQALEFIKSKRPGAHIEPDQTKALEQYALTINKK